MAAAKHVDYPIPEEIRNRVQDSPVVKVEPSLAGSQRSSPPTIALERATSMPLADLEKERLEKSQAAETARRKLAEKRRKVRTLTPAERQP